MENKIDMNATTLDEKIREAEQEEKVWACPVCGAEVLYSCYHDGQTFQSKKMDPQKAADLRENSNEYDPMTFECKICGEEYPFHPGARIGNGSTCKECADALERYYDKI